MGSGVGVDVGEGVGVGVGVGIMGVGEGVTVGTRVASRRQYGAWRLQQGRRLRRCKQGWRW